MTSNEADTIDWFGVAGSHLWTYSQEDTATAIAFLDNLKAQLANTEDVVGEVSE